MKKFVIKDSAFINNGDPAILLLKVSNDFNGNPMSVAFFVNFEKSKEEEIVEKFSNMKISSKYGGGYLMQSFPIEEAKVCIEKHAGDLPVIMLNAYEW